MQLFIFKYLKFKHIQSYRIVLSNNKITDIFYQIDEFCHEFEQTIKKHTLNNEPKRKLRMSCSEVIANTVSYNRFIELMKAATLPKSVFMKTCCLGEGTGIYFIDSTSIRVCKNKRIKRNKVFEGLAQVGKSTMGYLFVFELHIVINDKGELLNFVITPDNTDDRESLKNKSFIKALKEKLYVDKGYISNQLTQVLFLDGLHLTTSIRNNLQHYFWINRILLLPQKTSN